MPIEEKIMMHAERGEIVPTRKILKTPFQIEKIRKSAELNTAILDEVARQIHIGMSTQEIDDIVYRFTKNTVVSQLRSIIRDSLRRVYFY